MMEEKSQSNNALHTKRWRQKNPTRTRLYTKGRVEEQRIARDMQVPVEEVRCLRKIKEVLLKEMSPDELLKVVRGGMNGQTQTERETKIEA